MQILLTGFLLYKWWCIATRPFICCLQMVSCLVCSQEESTCFKNFLKVLSSQVVTCLLTYCEMMEAMEVHFSVDGKLMYGISHVVIMPTLRYPLVNGMACCCCQAAAFSQHELMLTWNRSWTLIQVTILKHDTIKYLEFCLVWQCMLTESFSVTAMMSVSRQCNTDGQLQTALTSVSVWNRESETGAFRLPEHFLFHVMECLFSAMMNVPCACTLLHRWCSVILLTLSFLGISFRRSSPQCGGSSQSL